MESHDRYQRGHYCAPNLKKAVMLRKLVVLISVFAFSGCVTGAPQMRCKKLYPKFDWSTYKKVAVVGSCEDINPELESVIVNSKMSPYRLIERAQLGFVAEEHGLALTPMMDPQELRRIGKLAGVDALVITQCRQSGQDVSASMRFDDVTTGEVKAVYKETYRPGRNGYEAAREAGAIAHQFYIAIGPCEVCADSPYGRAYCE